MERGNPPPDVKGEAQVQQHKSQSTDAGSGGGTARSSDEASVMEVEPRSCVVQLNKLNN